MGVDSERRAADGEKLPQHQLSVRWVESVQGMVQLRQHGERRVGYAGKRCRRQKQKSNARLHKPQLLQSITARFTGPNVTARADRGRAIYLDIVHTPRLHPFDNSQFQAS